MINKYFIIGMLLSFAISLKSQEVTDSIKITFDEAVKVIENYCFDSMQNPEYVKQLSKYLDIYNKAFEERERQNQEELKVLQNKIYDTIMLKFYIAGKEVVLNDNFNIYLVIIENKIQKVLKVNTYKDSFIFPKFTPDTCCGVFLLLYDNKVYPIPQIWENLKHQEQIDIYFDTKPFHSDQYIINDVFRIGKEKDYESYVYIRYKTSWTVGTYFIENTKEFFKEGKKLMRKLKKL